ncbi:BnaC06g31700D [Brassica napus]|uniref:BnaC06g31700D protein n=1 Tax=Brassica napus TaxID=3708 RepID=A0A078FF56_BRANA|nr:BnaC06g31700D [Brassica napus]
MGMDMVTKGVHNVIEFLSDDSPDMDVIGIYDNFFSDINKPAAVNCIEGHGSN